MAGVNNSLVPVNRALPWTVSTVSVIAHQRACQQRRPSITACTPGPAQPGHRPPYQWTATRESHDLLTGPRKRPLRHDGDVDDLDMHNNGHVNNITKNGTCGISTVCTQTALNVPVSEHNGHVKLVQEQHLWKKNGLVQAQFALCVPVSVSKQRP